MIGSAGTAGAVVVVNGGAVLALLPDVSARFLVLATLIGCSLVTVLMARTLGRLGGGPLGVWLGFFTAAVLTIPILRGLDMSLLPSPWGPWPRPCRRGPPTKPGTIAVSYSRNRTDFGEIIANPFEYRPRFLRIALPQRTQAAPRS